MLEKKRLVKKQTKGFLEDWDVFVIQRDLYEKRREPWIECQIW